MIADSSALVAILHGEPEEEQFKEAIARHDTKVSAVTALEAAIVLQPPRHRMLDELLGDAEISVVPFDATQARIAREAYARFGKGSGSKAGLSPAALILRGSPDGARIVIHVPGLRIWSVFGGSRGCRIGYSRGRSRSCT